MADIYETLGEFKAEMNGLEFAIAQEEDTIIGLQKIVKELQAKDESLSLELSKLEISKRLADSEYRIAEIEKESLDRQYGELSAEHERLDKILETKLDQLDEMKSFYGAQELAYNEIHEKNMNKYLAIPGVKMFLETKAIYEEYSQKVSVLNSELEQLKEECRKAESERKESKAPDVQMVVAEKDNSITKIGTTILESDNHLQFDWQNIPGIGAILAQLAKENQILKERLESLENRAFVGKKMFQEIQTPPQSSGFQRMDSVGNDENELNLTFKEIQTPTQNSEFQTMDSFGNDENDQSLTFKEIQTPAQNSGYQTMDSFGNDKNDRNLTTFKEMQTPTQNNSGFQTMISFGNDENELSLTFKEKQTPAQTSGFQNMGSFGSDENELSPIFKEMQTPDQNSGFQTMDSFGSGENDLLSFNFSGESGNIFDSLF